MIFHIGKNTPIDFGVTRSKIKVTITSNTITSKGQGHYYLKTEKSFQSITLVPFGPQYSNFIGGLPFEGGNTLFNLCNVLQMLHPYKKKKTLSGIIIMLSLVVLLLAHLSQSDRVSFCDHFSSGVRPASNRKLLL
jgi:hypothetical protein